MMESSEKLVNKAVDYICVYTRVSTKKQSLDIKHGLSYQKDLCKSYIGKHYSSVLNESYWEDIGSSYKNKLILREMGEMLRKLKVNSLILISEVSRLGRNYKMVEGLLRKIEKKDSYVVSVSENLVYGLSKKKNKEFLKKSIDSEKESDILSMRVKNTQSYIRKNGGYVGRAPFGYKIVKNCKNIPVLKENPEDFVIIDLIVNLSNDNYNYEEISNIMNTKNLFYKNKIWNKEKIKEILNKFYPEHMYLNIGENLKSNINIIDNSDYMEDSENEQDVNFMYNDELFLDMKDINEAKENLIVTIKNNKRKILYDNHNTKKMKIDDNLYPMEKIEDNNYLRLRSGKIIVK